MVQRPRGPFCGVVNGMSEHSRDTGTESGGSGESPSLTLPQCQQQSLSCVEGQKTARTALAPEARPPDPKARWLRSRPGADKTMSMDRHKLVVTSGLPR
jgi:hypothetical protein